MLWYSIVGFNVPLDTLYIGHFGDDFMGHVTQPTVSQKYNIG